MKIAVVGAIDNPISKNSLGGCEMWTYNLVEALVSHGVNTTLFASSGSSSSAKIATVCDHADLLEAETGDFSKPKYFVYCVNQIVEVLKREDEFDLIHLSIFPFFVYLPVIKLFKKPVVVTIHGYNRIQAIDAKEILENFPEPHYVYVSESFARSWPAPTNLTMIRNGIKTSDFEYTEEPDDYYLWVGRICEQKGIADAISFAQKTGEKLIIAGPIGDKALFEKSVQPFLNDSIKYVGEVNFKEKVLLYKKAKGFLFPLQSVEPLPLVVLEALASGVPVLSYDLDPMPEMIQNGLNGFLVQPGDVDAMAAVSKRIFEIKRLDCRGYVERGFDFDSMIKSYLKLYDKILKR